MRIRSKHRKQTIEWVLDWVAIAVLVLVLVERFFRGAPIAQASRFYAGMLIVVLCIGWRTVDLKNRRKASGVFLGLYDHG